MPMRMIKSETDDELLIERIMHARRYSLSLDKNRCVGCDICQIVCPREAIEVRKPSKMEGEKLSRPKITIDENKCQFCGICNAVCPFSALALRINDEKTVPVLKTDSFPQVIHEIEADTSKCPTDCNECEEACPFDLIKVRVETIEGEAVKDVTSLTNKGNLKVEVDIDRDQCPCCRLCEVECPYGVIKTRKIISGFIKINAEKCPEGCHDCSDVCPIPGALYLSNDGKVHANDLYCIYCGACKIVCPVQQALEIHRTSINHTAVHSGAWNKALEKLTSTKDVAKELRGKMLIRVQESVKKRVGKKVS